MPNPDTNSTGSESSNNNGNDSILTKKSALTYICQMLFVFIIVIAALINLSLPSTEKTMKEVWLNLIFLMAGWNAPQPAYKKLLQKGPRGSPPPYQR